MNLNLFLYFFCCELIFLFRNIVIWVIMIMNEVFFEFVDSGIGRSITIKKGKFIFKIYVYFRKDKFFFFYDE